MVFFLGISIVSLCFRRIDQYFILGLFWDLLLSFLFLFGVFFYLFVCCFVLVFLFVCLFLLLLFVCLFLKWVMKTHLWEPRTGRSEKNEI